MVPYTDVAFVAYIKSLFSGMTIVYAPPEIARQALARQGQIEAGEVVTAGNNPNIPPNPQNTIGVPGIAIFRTDEVTNLPQANMPMASLGRNLGIPSGTTNYGFNKQIPVKLTYSLDAYSRNYNDMNNICRTLRFCDVYQKLNVNVPAVISGVNETLNFQLFFEKASDPKYERVVNEHTPETIWFGVTQLFTVESYWINQSLTPQINEIFLSFYNQMTSGTVISGDLIEQITITS